MQFKVPGLVTLCRFALKAEKVNSKRMMCFVLQMTKLAIIPCTVFLETVFLRKQFSKRIQLSLLMLLVGVGIATVTDMQLNLLGAVISLFTIVTTCVAQIVSLPMSIACKVLMMEVSFCELLQLSIFVMHILMSQFFRNLKALSARTVCRE
jgi:solute carrier family 35 protein E3